MTSLPRSTSCVLADRVAEMADTTPREMFRVSLAKELDTSQENDPERKCRNVSRERVSEALVVVNMFTLSITRLSS